MGRQVVKMMTKLGEVFTGPQNAKKKVCKT